jgi:GNAT superfamily N-acetyltransferase
MNIINAQRKDKTRIIEILCQSFQNDPQINYILGSNGNKNKKLLRLMAYSFEFGLANGKVEISEDKNSVAIWKSSNSKKMTINLFYESILFFFTFGWSGIKRISAMEKKIAAFYPDKTIFNYLWILGTNPNEQGKGYGTAILSKAINNFEQNKVPIYLETSTDSNLKYYQRKRFELYHSMILDSETQLTTYLMRYV